MNREPSTAARALRAVSLAITLVSVVTFATIIYSAYTDTSGVLSSLKASTSSSGTRVTVTGSTARIDVAFNVSNDGLYPLFVQISCPNSASLPVTCAPVSVLIQPRLDKVVDLTLTVTNLPQLQSIVSAGKAIHLNATAAVSLEPFATLSATFDLGSVLSGVGR